MGFISFLARLAVVVLGTLFAAFAAIGGLQHFAFGNTGTAAALLAGAFIAGGAALYNRREM